MTVRQNVVLASELFPDASVPFLGNPQLFYILCIGIPPRMKVRIHVLSGSRYIFRDSAVLDLWGNYDSLDLSPWHAIPNPGAKTMLMLLAIRCNGCCSSGNSSGLKVKVRYRSSVRYVLNERRMQVMIGLPSGLYFYHIGICPGNVLSGPVSWSVSKLRNKSYE